MLSPISNDGERDFPTVLLSGSSIVGLDFNILEDILFVQSVSHVTCDMSNAYANPWDMVNNFCFDVYAQKGVFVIMSHVTCFMSNAYVDPWDMLNNFCFHV